MIRLGLLGFGNLGKFIAETCLEDDRLSAHFTPVIIWNRNADKFKSWKYASTLSCLSGELDSCWKKIERADCNLIVECSHPSISRDFGERIIKMSNFMPTSLTVFADRSFRMALLENLDKIAHQRAIFIPSGAAWGLQDVRRMAGFGHIKEIGIKMTFEAPSIRLVGDKQEELSLYQSSVDPEDKMIAGGTIEQLAAIAPNNVNTMVAIAMATGMEDWSKVQGELWASKQNHNHLVEIILKGDEGFEVRSLRTNPAKTGNVTGSQTFRSFLYSLYESKKGGNGLIFI